MTAAGDGEGEHHLVRGRLDAAARRVQTHRCLIGTLGENPRFGTTEATGMLEQRLENSFSDTAPPMSGRDAYFVDPEFGRRFIGVDIMNG